MNLELQGRYRSIADPVIYSKFLYREQSKLLLIACADIYQRLHKR